MEIWCYQLQVYKWINGLDRLHLAKMQHRHKTQKPTKRLQSKFANVSAFDVLVRPHFAFRHFYSHGYR